MTSEKRYDRHFPLFGEKGQERIQATSVAIVGLGGLGSHVAQQLAYLGVQGYALVDDDTATESSLNRLIGAVEEDVAAERRKVEVAARLIRSVQTSARVEAIPHRLEADEARAAIMMADVIFGCLDDDLARLRLTELCVRHAKPYVDLATDVGEQGGQLWYGGRVLFSEGGKRCLVCMGLLDQRDIARASMTPDQRAENDRLYGVPRSALSRTGPSVVSLNGVVASLAMTEFMASVSGLRAPWPYLIYRGDLGRVTLSTDAPSPDCYYCKNLWARRD